jgi:hypothetical protein
MCGLLASEILYSETTFSHPHVQPVLSSYRIFPSYRISPSYRIFLWHLDFKLLTMLSMVKSAEVARKTFFFNSIILWCQFQHSVSAIYGFKKAWDSIRRKVFSLNFYTHKTCWSNKNCKNRIHFCWRLLKASLSLLFSTSRCKAMYCHVKIGTLFCCFNGFWCVINMHFDEMSNAYLTRENVWAKEGWTGRRLEKETV